MHKNPTVVRLTDDMIVDYKLLNRFKELYPGYKDKHDKGVYKISGATNEKLNNMMLLNNVDYNKIIATYINTLYPIYHKQIKETFKDNKDLTESNTEDVIFFKIYNELLTFVNDVPNIQM